MYKILILFFFFQFRIRRSGSSCYGKSCYCACKFKRSHVFCLKSRAKAIQKFSEDQNDNLEILPQKVKTDYWQKVFNNQGPQTKIQNSNFETYFKIWWINRETRNLPHHTSLYLPMYLVYTNDRKIVQQYIFVNNVEKMAIF